MKWTRGPFLEIPDNERAWDSFLESPANFSCANLVPRVLFSKVREKRPGDEVVRARIGVLFSNHSAVKREQIIFTLETMKRRQESGIGISFIDS